MKLTQKKLKNNLEALFIDIPGSSTGSIQIWFRAGSSLEVNGEEGIAHFLEHMFFKGTTKRPGITLTKEIESFGGEVNAFTSFDYTCYYINSPSEYIQQSTDILLDMVTNPSFKQEDLGPEREVVFEEYRRSLDNPHQFAFKKIQEACFTGGYAHQILGTEQTIKNFSLNQLSSFRQRYYNSSNTLLIVSGNLKDTLQLEKLIEQYILPTGDHSSFPQFTLKNKNILQLHNKEVRMCNLNLIIQAPDYLSSHASAEDLAINCFGHGETSRMYHDLVLKTSLANHCSGSTMYFSREGIHLLRISFPHENLDNVFQTFLKTLKDALSGGFSLKEIEKIKNQYIASKIYEKESIESLAFTLGHGFAQNGNIHCEEQFIENIRNCDLEKVNLGLKNIFSRNLHLNLQLPLEHPISVHKKMLESFQQSLLKFGNEKKSINEKKENLKSKNTFKKSKFDSQLELVSLKNGIDLLYRKNTVTPTFVLHSYLKGGLIKEDLKNNGIYNIISSILTKGYDKIPYKKIKTLLEEKSCYLSGFTGKNSYGLSLHGQSKYHEELFSIFFGSLLRPDFLEKHIIHEKKMVRRALESQKEDPVKQCFKEVSKTFFQNHPYSKEILGNNESLKYINRLQLSKTHSHNLGHSEMLFTYCGNHELEEVVEIISKHTKTLRPRKMSKRAPLSQSPVFGKHSHITFDRQQTQIFMGLPAFKMGDKRDLYLKILTAYLSGQSSILFTEVRDRQGLCYSVHPVHFAAIEGGYWGIFIASGHDKTTQSIHAVKEIINGIKTTGFDENELARIKKMITGQNILGLQTNDDYANTYSIPFFFGYGIDFFYKENEQIQRISNEEINKFLTSFLNKEFNTILVGKN